jgi:hypothetical protein
MMCLENIKPQDVRMAYFGALFFYALLKKTLILYSFWSKISLRSGRKWLLVVI